METWPFKVVDDGQGNPKVEVQYLNKAHQFSPQEISAMVLTKVCKSLQANFLCSRTLVLMP
jgi:heat shock protein 1/8